MSAVLTSPTAIARFQWVSLRAALKAEKLGMRRSRRPSARQIVMRASGLPTKSTYDELIDWCSARIEEFNDDANKSR